MKKFALLGLCMSLFLISCGDDDDDSSGAVSYAAPDMSFSCDIDSNAACTTSMNGANVRGAFFSGECSEFGSSTTILSIGTATAVCSESECRNAAEGQFLTSWSQQLAAGSYSVYIFYDQDENTVPNNEPYACITQEIPASTNPNVTSFQ